MKQPPIQDVRSPHFAMEVAATAVFWGLWAYFIAPLVSLVLWAGGIHIFVEEMITLGGYEALIEKLTTYGLVVLVIAAVVNAWVFWNIRRYGDHNVRTHELAPVTLAESADVAGLRSDELERCQRARRLAITFDADDRLQIQESNAGLPPGKRAKDR